MSKEPTALIDDEEHEEYEEQEEAELESIIAYGFFKDGSVALLHEIEVSGAIFTLPEDVMGRLKEIDETNHYIRISSYVENLLKNMENL